jgi:hypothetical protein
MARKIKAGPGRCPIKYALATRPARDGSFAANGATLARAARVREEHTDPRHIAGG